MRQQLYHVESWKNSIMLFPSAFFQQGMQAKLISAKDSSHISSN